MPFYPLPYAGTGLSLRNATTITMASFHQPSHLPPSFSTKLPIHSYSFGPLCIPLTTILILTLRIGWCIFLHYTLVMNYVSVTQIPPRRCLHLDEGMISRHWRRWQPSPSFFPSNVILWFSNNIIHNGPLPLKVDHQNIATKAFYPFS